MHIRKNRIYRNTGLKFMITNDDYLGKVLEIEDLNPQIYTRNCISRWDLFKTGLWMAFYALVKAPQYKKLRD